MFALIRKEVLFRNLVVVIGICILVFEFFRLKSGESLVNIWTVRINAKKNNTEAQNRSVYWSLVSDMESTIQKFEKLGEERGEYRRRMPKCIIIGESRGGMEALRASLTLHPKIVIFITEIIIKERLGTDFRCQNHTRTK